MRIRCSVRRDRSPAAGRVTIDSGALGSGVASDSRQGEDDRGSGVPAFRRRLRCWPPTTMATTPAATAVGVPKFDGGHDRRRWRHRLVQVPSRRRQDLRLQRPTGHAAGLRSVSLRHRRHAATGFQRRLWVELASRLLDRAGSGVYYLAVGGHENCTGTYTLNVQTETPRRCWRQSATRRWRIPRRRSLFRFMLRDADGDSLT